MAIALVRNSGTVAGKTSASGELEVPVTAGAVGNRWIVTITAKFAPFEITDAAGDVFTKDAFEEASLSLLVSIWSAQIKSAATVVLKLAGLGSAELIEVTVSEWSGIQTTAGYVRTTSKGEHGSGTAATAGVLAEAPKATDLVFAGFGALSLSTFTPVAPYKALTGADQAGGSVGVQYDIGITATTAPESTLSLTGIWAGKAVVYKAAPVAEKLTGSTAGTSAFKATLEPNLSGKTVGTSAFTATLKTHTKLSGSTAGTSAFKATLEPNLSGKTVGTSAFTATLKTHRKLSGSTAGTSAFKADLKPRLVGKTTGTSGFTASLSTHSQFSGSTAGTSAFKASLRPRLTAATAGVSAFTASLSTHRRFSGSTSGTSNFTAVFNQRLTGSTAGTSNFTATLTTHRQLSGSFAGTSAFKATLNVHTRLTGSFTGTSHFTAHLVERRRPRPFQPVRPTTWRHLPVTSLEDVTANFEQLAVLYPNELAKRQETVQGPTWKLACELRCADKEGVPGKFLEAELEYKNTGGGGFGVIRENFPELGSCVTTDPGGLTPGLGVTNTTVTGSSIEGGKWVGNAFNVGPKIIVVTAILPEGSLFGPTVTFDYAVEGESGPVLSPYDRYAISKPTFVAKSWRHLPVTSMEDVTANFEQVQDLFDVKLKHLPVESLDDVTADFEQLTQVLSEVT